MFFVNSKQLSCSEGLSFYPHGLMTASLYDKMLLFDCTGACQNQMKQQNNHVYKSFCGAGAALICLLLLFSVFPFLPTDAQIPPSIDAGGNVDFDTRIKAFFTTLANGSSASAFEELLRQSPLGSPDINSQAAEQRNELRSKTDDLKTQLGEIVKWEKYETKYIGEDIALIRYILKHEHYPVIWTFTFYRKPVPASSFSSSNSWVVIGLDFDTNLR